MADAPSSGLGALVAIFTAIIGVSMVAVILSQRSQTASVLQALGSALSSTIGAAVSPVTGGSDK